MSRQLSIRNCWAHDLPEEKAMIIAACVEKFSGYTLGQLRERSARQPLAAVRLMTFLLLRELTSGTYKAVGKFMRRSHCNCLLGVKRILELCETDEKLRVEMAELAAMCRDELAKRQLL